MRSGFKRSRVAWEGRTVPKPGWRYGCIVLRFAPIAVLLAASLVTQMLTADASTTLSGQLSGATGSIYYVATSGLLQSMSPSGVAGQSYGSAGEDLAMAPDGTELATDDAIQRQVSVYDLNGDLLSQVDNAAEPAWSPDGKKIVFSYAGPVVGCSAPPGARATSNTVGSGPYTPAASAKSPYGLWIVNADGTSGLRQLTRYGDSCSGGDDFGTWSPDGNSIAFIRMVYSFTGCPWRERVYTANVAGSSAAQVPLAGNDLHEYSDLSWSGSELAFTRSNLNPQTCNPTKADVYVAPSSGGTPTDVSNTSLSDENWVHWSSDGSRLVVDNSKNQIATLVPDGQSAENVIAQGYEPNWIGAGGCIPAAPTNVAAVSGANFARIHWDHPASNGCAITGYVISDGTASRAVGPSTTGTDVYNLKPHHAYRFTVSSRGTTNNSAPIAAYAVIPSEPNHPCPGKDVKRSDVLTDGNVNGNTFWRAESDIIWCDRFDVATFEAVNQTSYTAWTDKIGFSWLAGPAADEIKDVLGYSVTPTSGYASNMTTSPTTTWPTKPGQTINVTTYPGFEIHDDLLTTALFAVNAIDAGAGADVKSLAEEIEKEKTAAKIESFFAKHQSRIDKELTNWLQTRFDHLAGSHSGKLKHWLGRRWKNVIDELAHRLADRLINIIGDPFKMLADKFLGKFLADLHSESTVNVPVYGKQVTTISPHGRVTATAKIPLFPLSADTYVKRTKSGR